MLGGENVVPDAAKATATKDPAYCGSCYGAEDETRRCCNTCEQIREQYRKKGWAFTNPERMEQVRPQR